jgi:hypothetical protein
MKIPIRVPVATRCEVVRENHGWSQKDVILDFDSGPDRDAAFYRQVVSNYDTSFDKAVIVDAAILTYLSSRQNVGICIDFCLRTDIFCLNNSRRVNKEPFGS